MKLFLRHQLPYISTTLALALLLISLFWLDGYHQPSLYLYGLVLVAFGLFVYLGIVYATQRQLYRLFTQEHVSGWQNEVNRETSPLSKSVNLALQQQYQMYTSELKQLQNTRDEHTRFINLWVHQMKTPLAVIELMIQGDELNQESLQEETDRLKAGLSLALNMARLESFQQDFVIEKVNLKSVATAAVAEHKRNFIRNYVYPKINIPEELTVETDFKWFLFCLDQILSNSIKYSAQTHQTIEIEGLQEEGQIKLQIRDHGIGIAQSDLPRIFQPFFTGNQGREHQEATGMGLYLVAEILRELDHTILVESTVGVGTTVTLTLQR